MHIFLATAILFLLIIQGGYYASAFLLAGIGGSIALIISKRKITLTLEMCGFFVVAFFYLFSTCINGISFSSLSQTMLPFVILVFLMISQNLTGAEKKKLVSALELLGFISSIVGILCFFGIISIMGGMNAGRLQYTFQYANAAGTWFAVCFILMRDSERKWMRYLSPAAIIALLFTKSVGAILILLVLQIVWAVRTLKQKNWKYSWVLIGVSVLALIGTGGVLWERIGQAKYTFIERLIQSYDGIRVMLKHPLGIGPGNWQYVFPFYQSAQYDARVIHNSYVQIGVDAGIVPFFLSVLFLGCMVVRFVRRKDTLTETALLILLHCTMEYNMFFSCISVLMVTLIGMQEIDRKRVKALPFGILAKSVFGGILFAIFCWSFYGTVQVKNMENALSNQSPEQALAIFKNVPNGLKNHYKESTIYTKVLCDLGRYEDALSFMEENENITSDMMEWKAMVQSELGELTVADATGAIEQQPYHVKFINQMSIYISSDEYSTEEKEQYNQTVAELNALIKKKPACWLNNQEELEYAKTN